MSNRIREAFAGDSEGTDAVIAGAVAILLILLVVGSSLLFYFI